MFLPDYVLAPLQRLNDAGEECFVVGGAVRSELLHLPVHDYDLATSATPDRMLEIFSRYRVIKTGIKHGTVSVVSDNHLVEITTYRSDAPYLDHRHPQGVAFTRSLREDCARRDFTVNALCYHPDRGIIDFFEGQKDLENKILRCIGNPCERLDEDALRILRAIRFAARLGFVIEPNTHNAILRKKNLLAFISRERIHDELNGFLDAPTVDFLTHTYLPVLQEFMRLEEPLPHLDRAYGYKARLAALLANDSAPATQLADLKYSVVETRAISRMVAHRFLPLKTRADIKKAMNAIEEGFADYISFRKVFEDLDETKILGIRNEIIAKGECFNLRTLAITGNDVKSLGFVGKSIANTLSTCLTLVQEDQLPNDKETLLAYAKTLT